VSDVTTIVGDRLAEHAGAWLAGVEQLAVGEFDADVVHEVRLASRRMRSVLATFGDLVLGDGGEHLRGELGWFARLLGSVRDPTVARDRLDGLLEGDPPLPEAVMARLHARYRAVADSAEVTARMAMGTPRFVELSATVRRLAEADLPDIDEKELLDRVRTAWRRLDKRATAVDPTDGRDAALHDVRKAAKRLHDVVATLAPQRPEALPWQKRLAALVALLGRRQDAVVSREHLRVAAASMSDEAVAGFEFGRLDAQEELRVVALDAEWSAAWHRVSSRKRRAWLD